MTLDIMHVLEEMLANCTSIAICLSEYNCCKIIKHLDKYMAFDEFGWLMHVFVFYGCNTNSQRKEPSDGFTA